MRPSFGGKKSRGRRSFPPEVARRGFSAAQLTVATATSTIQNGSCLLAYIPIHTAPPLCRQTQRIHKHKWHKRVSGAGIELPAAQALSDRLVNLQLPGESRLFLSAKHPPPPPRPPALSD